LSVLVASCILPIIIFSSFPLPRSRARDRRHGVEERKLRAVYTIPSCRRRRRHRHSRRRRRRHRRRSLSFVIVVVVATPSALIQTRRPLFNGGWHSTETARTRKGSDSRNPDIGWVPANYHHIAVCHTCSSRYPVSRRAARSRDERTRSCDARGAAASPFIGVIIMESVFRRAPEYARFLSDARGAIYPRFRCTLCIRVCMYAHIGMSIASPAGCSLPITMAGKRGGGGCIFATVHDSRAANRRDWRVDRLSNRRRSGRHNHFANIVKILPPPLTAKKIIWVDSYKIVCRSFLDICANFNQSNVIIHDIARKLYQSNFARNFEKCYLFVFLRWELYNRFVNY